MELGCRHNREDEGCWIELMRYYSSREDFVTKLYSVYLKSRQRISYKLQTYFSRCIDIAN
ncbi:unnamed protein product [Moneuplotes crassus]|uniref:Uncharacterized protein n=1 Tax=Euplotes crassus TaxID=5936 RepID=A0AAD1Y3T2_EUPCR|nr:unnamed protein product [Moneuplotes crassus]